MLGLRHLTPLNRGLARLKLIKFSLFCFLMVCMGGLHPFYAATPEQEKELEGNWKRVEKCDGRLGSRQLMNFMLEAAGLEWHPERISRALDLLCQMQDREVGSKTYGNFRWYWEQPKPIDLNAVEFLMQQGVLLWNFHKDILSPEDQAKFREMMEISVEGVRSHKVSVDYTNIYLMKTWNCIALGELLGRKELSDEGYSMFEIWYQYVSKWGISEYNSSTYYNVDIDNLSLIRKYAQKDRGREMAGNVIRLIWAQSILNWFSPAQRFGGPRSRDYDYLTGHGEFDRHALEWGLMEESKKSSLKTVSGYVAAEAPQDSKVQSLAKEPRYVVQYWGKGDGRYASQYIGKSFAMGVAGACAGPEDKFFAADFADQPKMVMISYFMDGRGDPYGQNKEKLKDGHQKSHHLIPFVASSQDGKDILFSASYVPNEKKGIPACLQSHLYFPIEAEIWVGNEKAAPMAPDASMALKPETPVYLRYKSTVVAFRFLEVTDCSGKLLSPVFYHDGDKYKAARISWIHSVDAPKGEAHFIVWATAMEDMNDDSFAKFRNVFSNTKVELSSQGGKIAAKVYKEGDKVLLIECDPWAGSRKSNTQLPVGILSVNGEEIGADILK